MTEKFDMGHREHINKSQNKNQTADKRDRQRERERGNGGSKRSCFPLPSFQFSQAVAARPSGIGESEKG